ncbi:cadherin-like domain-containing protein, partial [Vibrio crassostreae]|uniref:cadherin-like domain-containing protein n=1 Tax=Vibrio crassostreae TaxID=246167 RepID=UPI003D670DC6
MALNADGTFTFTPEKDYNGDVHFSYDVKDAHGGVTHTGATTTLTAVQDIAVISGTDSANIKEDIHVQSSGVIETNQNQLNVQDPDAGEALFTPTGTPSGSGSKATGSWVAGDKGIGQFILHADGRWLYKVDNDNTHINSLGDGDTFTETLTVHSKDGTAHTLSATVQGTNDGPQVTNVATIATTDEDRSITLTEAQIIAGIHATDAEGDHLSIDTLRVDAAHASLVHNADGTYTITPHANYHGDVAITGTVTDGAISQPFADKVLVTSVNDAPVISSNVTLAAGTEDTAVTLTEAQLLANASDVDHGETALLSVHNLSADHGTITDNKDGTYTFTPDADYNGAVHFTYDVQDPQGATVAASASMSLAAVADTPIVNVDIADTADNVLNASESAAATISGSLDPSVASTLDRIEITDGTTTVTVDKASITVAADGTYQTTADLSSLKDGALTVTAHATSHDGTTATSTDTIIKDSVATIHDNNASMNENQPGIHGNLIVDDESGVQVTGGLGEQQGNYGKFVIHANGSYTYTPDARAQALSLNEHQQETFTFTVTDKAGNTATETFQITLTGRNDGPVITNTVSDSQGATVEDGATRVSGQLSASDVDTGDQLSWEVVGSGSNPGKGNYGNLAVVPSTGQWVYRLDQGAHTQALGDGEQKQETFTLRVTDSYGASVEQTVVVTVTGTNDTPVVSSSVTLAAGTEDTAVTLTEAQLLANASDVDHGETAQLSVHNLNVDHGTVTNNRDGTYNFTPDKDYNGEVHFTYDVKDAHGGVTHTGATTNLAAVNDNPDVTPLTDSVSEGADNHHPLNLLVGATDKDGDSLTISHLEYAIDGQPQSGQLPTGITLDADGHTLIVDATDPAFNHLANGQSQQIAITYQVEDGHGGSTQQTATLTIAGTDDKATLVSNVIQLTETQALDSEFKSYRGQLQLIDPDSGDNTQFVFSGKYLGQGFAPGYLDVWPNGTYQFRLNTGTNHHPDDLISSLHAGESMELPYEVETTDGQKLTIMVKVTGEDNQAKIAVTPYSSLNNHVYEDHTSFGNTTNQLSSGGTLHVIDPDHDQAGFIAQTITTTEGGQFNINAQGHWSYNIDNDKVQHLGAGESFQQTFTVESIDGSAKKDITVTVHGTNDAPVASAEVRLANGLEDSKIVLTSAQLLANTSDVDDNDIGKLSIENLQADHGAIALNADGTFTFTPEKDYNGAVHFSYDVKDAHGGVTHTGASTTLSAVGDKAQIAGVDTGSITENTAGVNMSPDYAQPGIATLG